MEIGARADVGILLRPAALAATAAVGLLAAGVAAVAPLAAYTLGLALFGLPHVLSEMDYVARRFAGRIAFPGWILLGLLLAAIVGLRLAVLLGGVAASEARPFELGAVAALAAVVAPLASPGRRLPIAAVVLLLGVAALAAPLPTLLALAVLHNLTPIAFLAEAAETRVQRRRVVLGATAIFIGAPLLVATGAAGAALGALGVPMLDTTPLDSGPLRAQLGAYLPAFLQDLAWAPALFAAIVAAQLLHYAAVIIVLPRLLATPAARSSGRRRLGVALSLLTTALLAWLFFEDFGQGRSVYAIASAIHAWIEVPILLFALCAFQKRTPTANDAPLAATESSSAGTGRTRARTA
jgi:hypothetical protein